jgi:hypothetical protein
MWAVRSYFAIVATRKTDGEIMSYIELLDAWAAEQKPLTTSETYAVHLPLNDAARLNALLEMFPGAERERIITDLLSVAFDQLEAAIPYVPGNKVIQEDDHGDPIYEDTGLTPRFLELVKKHRAALG